MPILSPRRKCERLSAITQPVRSRDTGTQGRLDSMLGASPQCVEKGSDNVTLEFRSEEESTSRGNAQRLDVHQFRVRDCAEEAVYLGVQSSPVSKVFGLVRVGKVMKFPLTMCLAGTAFSHNGFGCGRR